MPETRTITIPVYRTPDGRPTCCRDGFAGEVCHLLGYTATGSACRWTAAPITPYPYDGGPWLQPSPDCPVWREVANG